MAPSLASFRSPDRKAAPVIFRNGRSAQQNRRHPTDLSVQSGTSVASSSYCSTCCAPTGSSVTTDPRATVCSCSTITEASSERSSADSTTNETLTADASPEEDRYADLDTFLQNGPLGNGTNLDYLAAAASPPVKLTPWEMERRRQEAAERERLAKQTAAIYESPRRTRPMRPPPPVPANGPYENVQFGGRGASRSLTDLLASATGGVSGQNVGRATQLPITKSQTELNSGIPMETAM